MSNQANINFAPGSTVVYPTHGVGSIISIEKQVIGGMSIELLVIKILKNGMIVRVPTMKAHASGLRQLCSEEQINVAISNLQKKRPSKNVLWSKRAQEYETKINSGKPERIAEVIGELFHKAEDAELSYSERQVYRSALDRLASEFAAIKNIDEEKAAEQIEGFLQEAA